MSGGEGEPNQPLWLHILKEQETGIRYFNLTLYIQPKMEKKSTLSEKKWVTLHKTEEISLSFYN